jgi:hypothetical protein
MLAALLTLLTLTPSLPASDCASGNCRVERSRKVERYRKVERETKRERTVIRRGSLRR